MKGSRKRSLDEAKSTDRAPLVIPDDKHIRLLLQDLDADTSDKCQQIIDQGNMLASSIQSAYRRRIETLPESVRNMTLAELFNTYNDNFEDVTRLNVAKMQESLEDFARTVSKGAGGSRFEVHENLCGMTPGVRTVLRSTRKLAGIDMSNIIQAPHENVPGSLRRSARNAAASNNSSNNTATSGVVAHSAAAGGVAATPSGRVSAVTAFQKVFANASNPSSFQTPSHGHGRQVSGNVYEGAFGSMFAAAAAANANGSSSTISITTTNATGAVGGRAGGASCSTDSSAAPGTATRSKRTRAAQRTSTSSPASSSSSSSSSFSSSSSSSSSSDAASDENTVPFLNSEDADGGKLGQRGGAFSQAFQAMLTQQMPAPPRPGQQRLLNANKRFQASNQRFDEMISRLK